MVRLRAGLLLLLALFFLLAFADRFELLFAALRALCSALHQLRSDQLEHNLLGSVALTPAQPDDPRVAALSLTETGSEFVEKLLNSFRMVQECRRHTPAMERVALGERDHLFDQRFGSLGLGSRGDNSLFVDDAENEI